MGRVVPVKCVSSSQLPSAGDKHLKRPYTRDLRSSQNSRNQDEENLADSITSRRVHPMHHLEKRSHIPGRQKHLWKARKAIAKCESISQPGKGILPEERDITMRSQIGFSQMSFLCARCQLSPPIIFCVHQ
ncbi:hypothetical protein MKW98_030657 [Papaver atlanticum]|uniref:Uncharacterized protein n=1 Tax=Papaver atlanticum TaxID=357466 RepID=A0AAD4X2H9_9MAGN|nr:hypothetical protein MKW98_030657 [Papaver atlanticum]